MTFPFLLFGELKTMLTEQEGYRPLSRKLFCLSLLLSQSEPGESRFQNEVRALVPLHVFYSCGVFFPIALLRP